MISAASCCKQEGDPPVKPFLRMIEMASRSSFEYCPKARTVSGSPEKGCAVCTAGIQNHAGTPAFSGSQAEVNITRQITGTGKNTVPESWIPQGRRYCSSSRKHRAFHKESDCKESAQGISGEISFSDSAVSAFCFRNKTLLQKFTGFSGHSGKFRASEGRRGGPGGESGIPVRYSEGADHECIRICFQILNGRSELFCDKTGYGPAFEGQFRSPEAAWGWRFRIEHCGIRTV